MSRLGDLEYRPCADGRAHRIVLFGDGWRTLCGDVNPELLPEDAMRVCMECSDIRHDMAAGGLESV